MALAAVVGEAFLSGFIEVVLDRLASPDVDVNLVQRLASPDVVDLIRGKKVDVNLVQRLKNTLYAVEAVLNDAEQKQFNFKDSAVNKWLDDLKDAVYVADDILDHISTKAAISKNNKVSTATNYFSRFFNSEERDMICKLENIVAKLEYIIKSKDILGLQHIATDHHSSWRTPSTSLVDVGSDIFGRDQDKEAILKLLLDDDNDDAKISVIPIVGMGGVGKTTLAQSVYNHDSVKKKFDVQAWACVSDHFDEFNITKAIMEAVTRSPCYIKTKELLHLDLKEKLTGKKFLIVLDDVWTDDYDGWNSLLRPLQYGTMGSKILVTTRIEKVASMVQTFQTYHLEQLSNEDCWSVFANHACLSPKESTENMDLHKIGKEIVRKCKGLPLAAQSLGGLLRRKRDIKDWDNILNSNIWENESKIIPALRISYHYLPPYLKRCFVYCSLYPTDYEFEKDHLILLWMAEDLLQPPKNGKTLEEVGYGYFDDLASRSFFQRSENGSFVMHDLMHDLATLLGGEFYLRREELANETNIGTTARHLSFSEFGDPVHENYDVFGRAKHLRTFLPINFRNPPFNNEKAPCIILSNLKCLRVLSFSSFQDLDLLPDSIEEMPNEMSKLKNLQHLSCFHVGKLGEKGIKELGTLSNLQGSLSITKLENVINSSQASEAKTMDKIYLEALLLSWSEDAKDHFTDSKCEMDILDKLQPTVNLKRLNIEGCNQLGSSLPKAFSIRELNIFESNKVALHELPHSLEELRIEGTEVIESVFEAIAITLPTSLQRLYITDCSSAISFPGDWLPTSLKVLYITNCKNLNFPKLNQRHESLQSLRIAWSCDSLSTLPLDNLPNLDHLVINNCENIEQLSTPNILSNLRYIWICDCPKFVSLPCHINTLLPKLQLMHVGNCPEMETFPEGGMPPSLRSLHIWNCEKLMRNPSLTSFDMISILKIGDLHDDAIKSFPNKGSALLPPSLTSLILWRMTSLQTLECTLLLHLTSLQQLELIDCPKLENMEGERLPASLVKIIPAEFSVLLGQKIDNNQRPRFPGKIEASTNVMRDISIGLTPQSWDLKTMTREHGLTELCRQAENRDVSTALSVIQSNTSAATFLASVSLTLSSLIGAWIANSSNIFLRSQLINGDTSATAISIKPLHLHPNRSQGDKFCNSPGPTNIGGLGTATPRSSPPPSLVEFLPSMGIEPCTLGFKYMFNPFPLPIVLVSTIGSGNGLNMVRGSIPTKGKNSTREGGGEDREVAVPGPHMLVGPGLLQVSDGKEQP
ncbi:hypothetical protein TSUD_385570 [Trifolium subterraneum]|uniref:NB-ARC domain-containing protein n=1 Tax=Trifolium subterraneum TaxID=3900 RepID=A0A2Z6LVQ6_TRISU|nr:hypothetical protein TSUD_385570 [Trifolium subterraneum]